MKQIFATYRRKRKELKRAYPISTIVSLFLNGVFMVIFPYIVYHYAFKEQLSISFKQDAKTVNYMAYICLGAMFHMMSMTSLLSVGQGIMAEIREGTIANLFLSPAGRVRFYIGCYCEQLDRMVLQMILVTLVSLGLGATYSISFLQLARGGGVFLLALFCFFSTSVFVSGILIFTRESYLVLNTLFVAMDFLCGVIFPVTFLWVPLQWIARLFPLTTLLEIFRGIIIQGESLSIYGHSIFFVAVQSTLYLILGVTMIKKWERKIIEEVFL